MDDVRHEQHHGGVNGTPPNPRELPTIDGCLIPDFEFWQQIEEGEDDSSPDLLR
jgi:hypothetical protein